MNVQFKIRDSEKIQAFLKSLSRGTMRTAIKAIAEYLLGNESRGLRHYEPYKYVKPFRSYSADPVKAARQRRWIFAHLDIIGKNNRTGNTSAAWTMKELNNGYNIKLENKSKGAQYIWGDSTQTRHQKAVGHRTISNKVASNLAGAMRHAGAEVRKWIKANKPSTR